MRFTDNLANMLRLGLDTDARERFGLQDRADHELTWNLEDPDNFDASPF